MEEDGLEDLATSSGQPLQSQNTPQPSDKDADPSDGIHVLEHSRSQEIIEEMLSTYYTPMEVWYARTVIDKVMAYLSVPLCITEPNHVVGSSTIDVRFVPTSSVDYYAR